MDTTDIRIQINPNTNPGSLLFLILALAESYASVTHQRPLRRFALRQNICIARYRTSDLTDFQHAVAVCSIDNGISDICCFRGVILSPLQL